MPIRILIVDDHGIIRQGLRLFLEFDPELVVVGEATNGIEALKLVESLQPDVVLMDILMPLMDGLEATLAIRQEFPDTEVIILTSVVDENIISQCIRAGASGYLLKDTRSEELCGAVHAAVDGQIQLSKQIALKLAADGEDLEVAPSLTSREEDVLKLVAQGCSNKEICLALNITEKTVKAHVGNIFRKIGVNSRTQATLYALRVGLVHLE
jgi:DNA-binding NarL/FixJ family response regulator